MYTKNYQLNQKFLKFNKKNKKQFLYKIVFLKDLKSLTHFCVFVNCIDKDAEINKGLNKKNIYEIKI